MQTLDFTKMSISFYASNTYSEEERLKCANIAKMKLEEYGFIVKKQNSKKGSIELFFDINIKDTIINLNRTGAIIKVGGLLAGAGLFLYAIKRLAGGPVVDKYYKKICKVLEKLTTNKVPTPTAITIVNSKELDSAISEEPIHSIFPDKSDTQQTKKMIIVCYTENEESIECITTLNQSENSREFTMRYKGPI